MSSPKSALRVREISGLMTVDYANEVGGRGNGYRQFSGISAEGSDLGWRDGFNLKTVDPENPG
jgi:hypothetical protein